MDRRSNLLGGATDAPMPRGARRAWRWAAPHRFTRLSIRSKILLALLMVVLLMSMPYVFLIVSALQYKQQYDAIIQNITAANSINGSVKHEIDDAMWTVIAGKVPFAYGSQYQILDRTDARVQDMLETTRSHRGRIKLVVVQRTLGTLRVLVDRVGVQINQGRTFDENMVLMERIRDVSQLVEDNVQEYALFEVNTTQEQYYAMLAGQARWAVAGLAIIIAAVLFSIGAAWRIAGSIYVPIKQLHDVTSTITRQDLEALVADDNADEITQLGLSFNVMVGKVRELLQAKVQEHENLKKAELRALQAQINPHFLYNTLDAIIWMAEANRTAQVVEMVRALSRFFRITLSKGRDWISLREEVEHVSSYLAIQKIRYRDILDYRIEMDDGALDGRILKLTLQPLVENALYHGIKSRRGGGAITVRGRREGDQLLVEVEDNGIGMTPERLTEVRAMLAGGGLAEGEGEGGYGINNVNQRLTLYYGAGCGLVINSEHGRGTRVSLRLPA